MRKIPATLPSSTILKIFWATSRLRPSDRSGPHQTLRPVPKEPREVGGASRFQSFQGAEEVPYCFHQSRLELRGIRKPARVLHHSRGPKFSHPAQARDG